MNCQEAERHLPGYLDGAIEYEAQHRLRVHLEACHGCRSEADRYRLMSRALSNLEAMPVPTDLAVKIRIHASKATPMRSFARRIGTRMSLVFGNILAPIALPATGGVLATIGVFVLLLQNLLVGVPMGSIVANDLQLNLVQPAYLESLGPIPAPTFDMGLTLDATVNAQGQAVDYKIISGPTDPVAQRQIDQLMLLSKFRPRLNDGKPTSGGHVVLNFNSIRVKG
jgi:anti-sigma factor RsiW